MTVKNKTDDKHALALAVAQNVATNGRLFCGLICLINLNHHPVLAVLATVPIGASCIVDQLPCPSTRLKAAVATYALAAFVAVATIFFNWS